jgi:ribose 5-phosphate isomerase B
MKITIGSDHRGYEFKKKIKEYFSEIEWIDVGTDSVDQTDYPIYAKKVCRHIVEKKSDVAILLCGSGIGMSIAANRYKGVYAALCWNAKVAMAAKEDDNANILVIPADFVEQEQVYNMIEKWLQAQFKDGRHKRRLAMIDAD